MKKLQLIIVLALFLTTNHTVSALSTWGQFVCDTDTECEAVHPFADPLLPFTSPSRVPEEYKLEKR